MQMCNNNIIRQTTQIHFLNNLSIINRTKTLIIILIITIIILTIITTLIIITTTIIILLSNFHKIKIQPVSLIYKIIIL